MSVIAFVAVLCAALLHASWNAVIRLGSDRAQGMLLLTLGNALVGVPVILLAPFPGAEVWPWLIASGAIHTLYQVALMLAFEQGDLSRAYPISRGAAPLMVAVVSVAFLADRLDAAEALGIAILGLGIIGMANGALQAGESRRLVPYALLTACATAAYTLVDGLGARVMGAPVAFVGWLLILSAIGTIPVIWLMRGADPFRTMHRHVRVGLFAGLASFASYAIAVWAMTVAPIALVAALRETSILFAVLIGWLAFGERMDRTKIAAAFLIVLGVVLTRL